MHKCDFQGGNPCSTHMNVLIKAICKSHSFSSFGNIWINTIILEWIAYKELKEKEAHSGLAKNESLSDFEEKTYGSSDIQIQAGSVPRLCLALKW